MAAGVSGRGGGKLVSRMNKRRFKMARALEAGSLDIDESAERQTRYRVPAVDKALAILELLSTEANGLPMAILAERLERTISEIYRTVQLLEARGSLERTADGGRYAVRPDKRRVGEECVRPCRSGRWRTP